MFAALQRTSMSPIIYETLDNSVGVADARSDLITQGMRNEFITPEQARRVYGAGV